MAKFDKLYRMKTLHVLVGSYASLCALAALNLTLLMMILEMAGIALGRVRTDERVFISSFISRSLASSLPCYNAMALFCAFRNAPIIRGSSPGWISLVLHLILIYGHAFTFTLIQALTSYLMCYFLHWAPLRT